MSHGPRQRIVRRGTCGCARRGCHLFGFANSEHSKMGGFEFHTDLCARKRVPQQSPCGTGADDAVACISNTTTEYRENRA